MTNKKLDGIRKRTLHKNKLDFFNQSAHLTLLLPFLYFQTINKKIA